MKFLIAGFGSIGRRHFRNLLSLGERDIIIFHTHHSTIPEDELEGFTVETDLQAALAHLAEAVIIANPTSLHMDVAIPAAMGGSHLLIEKPISHSLARLDELKEVVEKNHCKVLVGFQFRFHPGLQQLKMQLDEGAIGEPISARAHWGEYLPDWHPWEDYKNSYAARPDLGGGVVLTLSHPLDYLRWILGDVDSIQAYVSHKGLNLLVEDTAEITMRFANGTLGSLHLDFVQRPPAHWLEIVGTHGTLHWDNADGITKLSGIRPWENAVFTREIHPPEGFERNSMFLDELFHFRKVINSDAEPICNLHDGEMALRLALAALQENEI